MRIKITTNVSFKQSKDQGIDANPKSSLLRKSTKNDEYKFSVLSKDKRTVRKPFYDKIQNESVNSNNGLNIYDRQDKDSLEDKLHYYYNSYNNNGYMFDKHMKFEDF